METVFEAGRQARKVRVVMACSLACAVVAIWLGLDMMQSYGLREADGGVLAPWPIRFAWGAGVSLAGLGFAIGMGIYGRCYITRMAWHRAGREIEIDTLRWIGTERRIYPLSALVGSEHDQNQVGNGWIEENLPVKLDPVNAPWSTLRFNDRRLPFLLDLRGTILDDRRFRLILRLGARRDAARF